MRRALLLTLALSIGLGAGEYLAANFAFHRALGRLVRRGELAALVGRRGIYDRDVERAWRAQLFANGAEPADVAAAVAAAQRRDLLEQLIVQEKLNIAAAGEAIRPTAINREMDLLRWQFGDEKSWSACLQRAATTPRALRRALAVNLRARAWLEAHLSAIVPPNDTEVRRFYGARPDLFRAPIRLRVSHLFLAAPEGYPDEVIAAKRTLINQLAARLRNGESFPALVAEFSEDEATKRRDGDLNYFAEKRMLPAIWTAAQTLQDGETSDPIRSPLGFHILQLTQKLPAQQLSFLQAAPEIAAALDNQKRSAAIAALLGRSGGKIEIATRRN